MYGLFGQNQNGLQFLVARDSVQECADTMHDDYSADHYDFFMTIELKDFVATN